MTGSVISETRQRPPPVPDAPVRSRHRPHLSDVLLPIAIGLWAYGISQTIVGRLGMFGLPPVLPAVLYAGIGMLVLSASIEVARTELSSARLACHATALVVMLYGIAPLIYSAGRYSWLYKTVGPVQYINAFGQLNRSIDIYQNWPGFFAFSAWFDKVAGVGSPLAYAKWAQFVFELAALPLLYLIYRALSLGPRQRWVAIWLYSASNWIGQDYFSPQALGTVLGLGIMAIAIRWLYVGNQAPPVRPNAKPPDPKSADPKSADPKSADPKSADAEPPAATPPVARRSRRQSRGVSLPNSPHTVLVICALLLCYFVLAITHELSPYILAVQLGTLAAVKWLRPRWIPAALAAIALAYLIPRFSFVNSRYGLLNSIGDFFSNASPPAFSATGIAPGQKFIERTAEVLSVGIWALSAVAAWRRRRAGRVVLVLVLLAYSPVVLLGFQAYGHEGILRVFLFSLPWSAALASMILAPSPLLPRPCASSARISALTAAVRRPMSRTLTTLRLTPRVLDLLRAPLAIGVALALFFPAFFGDDSFNQMPQSEVNMVTAFWDHSQPGPVYVAIDDAPVADTSRYDLFRLHDIFGSGALMASAPITLNIANVIAQAASHTPSAERVYVMVTPTMQSYAEAYGIVSATDFTLLIDSLALSPSWTLITDKSGVVIYELQQNAGQSQPAELGNGSAVQSPPIRGTCGRHHARQPSQISSPRCGQP